MSQLDGITSRQARLRVDLFSAAFAIWSWGHDHYPALAYSLYVARTDVDDASMGFPASTALFRRLLRNHLDAGTEPDERADEIVVSPRHRQSIDELGPQTVVAGGELERLCKTDPAASLCRAVVGALKD